jgi:hypothetical protein
MRGKEGVVRSFEAESKFAKVVLRSWAGCFTAFDIGLTRHHNVIEFKLHVTIPKDMIYSR